MVTAVDCLDLCALVTLDFKVAIFRGTRVAKPNASMAKERRTLVAFRRHFEPFSGLSGFLCAIGAYHVAAMTARRAILGTNVLFAHAALFWQLFDQLCLGFLQNRNPILCLFQFLAQLSVFRLQRNDIYCNHGRTFGFSLGRHPCVFPLLHDASTCCFCQNTTARMGCFPYACPKCGGGYERCGAKDHDDCCRVCGVKKNDESKSVAEGECKDKGHRYECAGGQFCWVTFCLTERNVLFD